MPRTVTALAAILASASLAGCVAIDEPAPAEGPLPIETIDQGQRSGVEDRRTVVVRDQAAWEALWSEHRDDGTLPPREDAPPAVDFDVQMVVAVFKGRSSDACHGANITGIAGDGNGNVVVRGEWIAGVEGRMCAEVITYPFHIVATSEVDEKVVFDMVETTGAEPA